MAPDDTWNGLDLTVQPVTTSKTSIVLNPLAEPTPQRTYVTFGVERGGTSLVAGVLRALGLYLGDIPEGNNEDKAFHNKTLGQMKATINRRNSQHDVWGWKYPAAASYLPVLSKSIRNAYFVIVYRDVVATALSRNQWDGEFIRRPVRMSLHETNSLVNANTGFALATRRPCLLISNEKAMAHASELIDEVADFLCVERPDDDLRARIVAYSEPGRYKNFDDYFASSGSPSSTPATGPTMEQVSGQ
jgi:hypothetical protein